MIILQAAAASASAPQAHDSLIPSFQQIATSAGPVAFAAFAGVFLGGVALSAFWKNFGPWQLLESCREQCAKCDRDRVADQLERERIRAEVADYKARYEVLLEAVNRSGLGLRLTPPPRPGE